MWHAEQSTPCLETAWVRAAIFDAVGARGSSTARRKGASRRPTSAHRIPRWTQSTPNNTEGRTRCPAAVLTTGLSRQPRWMSQHQPHLSTRLNVPTCQWRSTSTSRQGVQEFHVPLSVSLPYQQGHIEDALHHLFNHVVHGLSYPGSPTPLIILHGQDLTFMCSAQRT